MPTRWTLDRAGIVNVYQYSQETLHFAGGRLLLRGVNGSGKSTAMNMLLPFLLDADTRRIDAAGEQSGVLKSWMLSGRDDPQPVGYLWIELARADEHLTCGCGIKANRSADTVTTWWFITSRRPGIDLDLVEGRHPLSQEALRAALDPEPVFRHDQRAGYRAEVRSRLFGGADLDQHIRLLHVVRNPRVGDRIDLDLPGYLRDALPQLSEAALEDAAQPLDDLEEHRHNVDDLRRTADTLGALVSVYAGYARGELRRRAADARGLAAEAEAATRAQVVADGAVGEAERSLAEAAAAVDRLEGDEARLRRELETLRASPAYQEGRELNDLRAHVKTLQAIVDGAAAQVHRLAVARAGAEESLTEAASAATASHSALAGHLRELAECLAPAGLAARAPDVPALVVAPGVGAGPAGAGEAGDTGDTGEAGRPPPVRLPPAEIDGGAVHRGLAAVRQAVSHRRGDLAELARVFAAVDAAERRLADAQRAHEEAAAELEGRREASTAARRALDGALRSWRTDLGAWIERLDRHCAACGVDRGTTPDLGTDLATRRGEVVAGLTGVVDKVVDRHVLEVAGLEARRQAERATVDELVLAVEELEAQVLPAPPALAWQRPGRRTVLAEVVDFAESVTVAQRAALEAALEASGILGAELAPDGSLELPEGGLVLRAGRPASQPLSRWLTVTTEGSESVDDGQEAIRSVLDTISTDPTDLDTISTDPVDPGDPGGDHATVVTADGRFRIGVLRGRHVKAEAEHIGAAARRAALERRRAEARSRRDAAREVLARTESEARSAQEHLDDIRAIRDALPPELPVARAVVAAEQADADVARAEQREATLAAAEARAEADHAEAVDASRRTAATLGLPLEPEGRRRVAELLEDATRLSHRADDRCDELVRALSVWRRAAERLERAMDDERESVEAHRAAVGEHELVAVRLATLEDSIGVAYEEIVVAVTGCETELGQTVAALAGARQAQLDEKGRVTRALDRAAELKRMRDAAVSRAVAALPRLRAALEVPGLLAAATAPAEPVVLAPVEETPRGVADLTAAIERRVPPPERAGTTAESVRQSLRQRRDSLGAGWDAEDRQDDETLPLAVEVNGPQGRMPLADARALVGSRLAELTALLTSEQDNALRNLLQGMVAREIADKLHAARELVALMNRRLDSVKTAHGIGVSLRWTRRADLDAGLAGMIDLLAKPPDLRTAEQNQRLREALAAHLDEARLEEPDAPYRDLVGKVLDYRTWYDMTLVLHRPGRSDERLGRRTALSEGEKKVVSYLPLFAAVAASCDSLAESAPDAPRFVLLDDAFAKVSEDNHPKLFGLLVQLDLDFIATSERLWGTHSTVPELAITEVLRDADLGVIVLEHSRWDGAVLAGQA